MKYTPSELISTFRKKISFQAFLSLALLLAGIIIVFVTRTEDPLLDGVFDMIPIVLLVICFDFFDRKRSFSGSLAPESPSQTIEKLGGAMEKQHKSFHNRKMLRLGLSTVWLISLFLLMYLLPHSRYTGMVLAGFAGMLLVSAIHGWTLMHDQLFLQDLKRLNRDSHSGIS